MDAEPLGTFLLTLPHVAETRQWGDNLVFWVGDKAIGGKMFALINLDPPVPNRTYSVLAYAAGPERFAELLEIEGLLPSPYAARNYWVAAEHWQVFPDREWQSQLHAAHQIIFNRLPPKTREVLALPATARKRLISDRRKLLAAQDEAPPPAGISPAKKSPAMRSPPKPAPAKRRTALETKAGKPRSRKPPSR